jgi:hypothetical protein
MPKTGSSAIQAFLTLNHDILKKRGFEFPSPPHFDQAYQTSTGNVGMFHKLFINNDLNTIRKTLESFKGKHDVILSAEALFDCIRDFPDSFFEVFNEYDYKIICYVRRQDNLLSSSYKQVVKNHDGMSLDIIDIIAEILDFSSILVDAQQYTSSENIIVRPYEKQQFSGGNIFSDFLHCIGLELEEDYIFPDKIVNPSLNLDALEFRRLLNNLEVDKNNVTNKNTINALLAKYTVENNKGKPFQDDNIFSPRERIEIINTYKEKNEEVAKVFLQRESGILFYDVLPEVDELWEPNGGITFEKAVDISKYMLETKFEHDFEQQLINNIVKSTIDSILDTDMKTKDQLKGMPVIYNLSNKPIALSEDVAVLERKNRVWYIESSGIDPYFIIPNFDGKSNEGNIYIEIAITSTTDTILQLFYMSSNNRFDNKHCLSKSICEGYNKIIFHIEEEQSIKKLRLDPGNMEAIYLLHTFEVRKGNY